MAWEPKRHVFDATPAVENLLGFFEVHQTDALTWANGDSSLPNIKKFYNSARIVTVFPALSVLQSFHRSSGEDRVDSEFQVVIECGIQGGKQDETTEKAKKYALAIESMCANMAETTLFQNSIIPIIATLRDTEVEFDLLGQRQKRFIQIFQIRATWECSHSGF